MAFRDWPIQRKLTAIFLVISGVVLLLTVGAFAGYQYWSFRQSARTNLATLGRVIAANSTASLAFQNAADGAEILSALRAEPQVAAAALYDDEGAVFATYPAVPGSGTLPTSPGEDGYRFERWHLIGFQPISEPGGRRLGTLYLDSSLDSAYGALRLSGLIALAVIGLALIAAFLLSAALQRRITGPILELAETARTVSDRGDYSVRAPEHGRDEVGSLTNAFNQMLGRIADQDRALRESKDRLDLALRSAAVGTWTWEVGTNALIWDDFLPPLFGLPSGTQPKGYGDFLAVVHPDDRSRLKREGRDAIDHGAPYDTEYRVVWPDGSDRVLASRGKVHRDVPGGSPRLTGVCWDVTQRRRAEELRRSNEQLIELNLQVQQANRLKSEFLANMSHELRTPLNGIIGFTELMHDGKVGQMSPTQQEYLNDILTSARHLLQLINDVLDLAKVESGKMEFHPEPVKLAVLVGEVRDVLRTLAAQKRVVIETELDPTLGLVTLDPSKLKQVLYNYLSNALKFSHDGGVVSLRVLAENAEEFRLEVEDRGMGIKPQDLERLFIEFEQLDGSAAKRHGGTGLGLALTKRFVEAQGGRVEVRSVPGAGSVFAAILPRHAKLALLQEAEPVGGSPGAPRILVVEDDQRDRTWIIQMLADAGYAVEAVATGADALARCSQVPYAAITLDVLLPDMPGQEVLRRIRGEGPNRETPVIIATVVADKGVAAGFRVHDVLTKPIAPDDLLGALARAQVARNDSRPILVVDDDPRARKLAEKALTDAGYRVRCAAGGEEGLEVAGEFAPAAVVLDLMMPGMDGFGFLKRFRATPAGRQTPVIVWTVKDLTREEDEMLRAATQALISKGEGAALLLAELAELAPLAPAVEVSRAG
jgi:signal transduction histidine kinase/CheY-like chemotaxis protein